jgi:ElaB/YqjD/DUF883 family membrane-anchored ribosome-binding protein
MAQAASGAEKHNGGAAPADHAFEKFVSDLEALDEEVRRFVRDKPLIALGAAVAAGYVIGRILSRL